MESLTRLKNSIEGFWYDLLTWEEETVHEKAYSRLLSVEGVYDQQSQEMWNELLQKKLGEYQAIHHLAVMHHARAYDLESEESPEALLEWEKALELWAKLVECDPFWEELEKRGRQYGDLFDPADLVTLRSEIPRFLLEVHLDLIREYGRGTVQAERLKLAAQHMSLIKNSPFLPDLKKELIDELYQEFTGGLHNDMEEKKFELAVKKVKDFLEINPDYVPALRDIIDVYNKWNDRHWANRKNLIGINLNIRDAKPYVDKLEANKTALKDFLVKEVLAEHYFMKGIALDERPKDTESRQGCTVAVKDCDEAIEAYHKSYQYDGGKRTQQQTNRMRFAYNNKGSALVSKAGFCSYTKEKEQCLDEALEALHTAEDLAVKAKDKSTKETSLFYQALAYMEKEQWNSALGKLDEFIKTENTFANVHMFRAQCLMKLGRNYQASGALELAERLAENAELKKNIMMLRMYLNMGG